VGEMADLEIQQRHPKLAKLRVAREKPAASYDANSAVSLEHRSHLTGGCQDGEIGEPRDEPVNPVWTDEFVQDVGLRLEGDRRPDGLAREADQAGVVTARRLGSASPEGATVGIAGAMGQQPDCGTIRSHFPGL
jgi:hypothetical protein